MVKNNIKNCPCYYFDGNKISVYNISYKTLIDDKLLRIRFNKTDEFDKFMVELDI